MTEQDIKKGLAGVVVDTTAISKVNPETNSLLYRGSRRRSTSSRSRRIRWTRSAPR